VWRANGVAHGDANWDAAREYPDKEFVTSWRAAIDALATDADAVLLVRPDFAGTDGRVDMFNRAALEFTCCWRPVWIPGTTTSGRWWAQWFAWLANREDPPVNRRLREAELRGLTPAQINM
jgi:hypothetical protein